MNQQYEWTKKEIFNWSIDRIIKTLSGFWIIAILAYIICQIINGKTETVFFQKGTIYGIVQLVVNFFGLSNLFKTATICSAWWYMSIAILFIIFVPIFAKIFKKYNYFTTLAVVVALPRILGWEYVNSSFISFLFPVLLGMICAENNLLVRIANFKIVKKDYLNKALKFIIEMIIIIGLAILYTKLPNYQFYEIRYGIIPFFLICYLYEFLIDLPIIRSVLKFLGKHSMNIFLIHEFIRTDYLNEWIYSFNNFAKIAVVLLLVSLAISIILELFKKLIRYEEWIQKLQNLLKNKKYKLLEK